MATHAKTIETIEAAPTHAELMKTVANTVNTITGGTADAVKKVLGHTDAKVIRDASAKADLEKFKKEVMEKAERDGFTNAIRKEIREKVLKTLAAGVTPAGSPDTFKFTDAEAAEKKYKDAEEKADKEAKEKADKAGNTPTSTPANPEVEASVPTVDNSAYTMRQAAGVGVLGAGALAAGTAVSGISSMATGSSTIPLLTRFGTGAMNFLNGTRDVLWQKTGLSYLWTNGIVNPLTSLTAKLGISTGTTANTAALAGLPSWMGTAATGGLVLGGAYAGSKLLNWAGHKIGVEPKTIPFLGKLPIIGPILNSFITVPPQAAWKGVTKVAGWGKSTFDWMWGTGKAAVEKRNAVGRFGLGALIGGGIVAGLTGGSSLLWGLIGGEAARRGLKGKSWTDFIPAPFGVKKSGGGGGH